MSDDPTDRDLVRSAVRNAGRLSKRRAPRWWHVSEALAVGSTLAASLCHRFGFDPDEEIGGGE